MGLSGVSRLTDDERVVVLWALEACDSAGTSLPLCERLPKGADALGLIQSARQKIAHPGKRHTLTEEDWNA